MTKTSSPETLIALSDFDFRAIVREGDTIGWPQAIGEPLGLTARLIAQRAELPRPRLFFGMGASKTLTPDLAEHFTFLALNGAGTNRRLTGLTDIVPAHVSTFGTLLRSRAIAVDIALIRVRPLPDGRLTTGVISDFTQALVASARVVVAEVDERLPITLQDAILPREAVHHFVTAGADEVLMPDPEPSAIENLVAANVAGFIPNQATVQLGVGTMSVAISRALLGHRDLGIHSGVVSDVFVDMIESGAVTNAHKGIDVGLSVTGGLFGTRRLIDFASNNPAIAMRSGDHTHSQVVMSQINKLHTLNSCVEIDVTGQVNSEIAAGRYLGAVGGQPDFVRGGQISPGGRSILSLPSTTPDGKISRIVASLKTPVTTARSDIDAVITEHGVAELRGCSLSERARRLIAIAHPDFRGELRAAAGLQG
jgi:acyl-CoA hydrolase